MEVYLFTNVNLVISKILEILYIDVILLTGLVKPLYATVCFIISNDSKYSIYSIYYLDKTFNT